MSSLLRIIGLLLLVAGSYMLFKWLQFDTSVETEFGRVNNLGLMDEKQSLLIFTCVSGVVGLISLIGGEILGKMNKAPK